MYEEMAGILASLVPSREEAVNMAVGAVMGWITYAIGGIDVSIQWLCFFIIVDYVSGVITAMRLGEYSSAVGFRGIFRKIFIFVMVAMCNGLDVIIHIEFISLRNMAIFAYAINEACSILENLDRGGMGHLIPPFVRGWIKSLKKKAEDTGKLLEEKNVIHEHKTP